MQMATKHRVILGILIRNHSEWMTQVEKTCWLLKQYSELYTVREEPKTLMTIFIGTWNEPLMLQAFEAVTETPPHSPKVMKLIHISI